MNGQSELLDRLGDAATRRCWLLVKAVESLPLDRALELARDAEAFVTGLSLETRPLDARSAANPAAAPGSACGVQSRDEISLSAPANSTSPKRDSLALPAEKREKLLERLAAGCTNVELAAEFDITPRQVQGLRISSFAKRQRSISQIEASIQENNFTITTKTTNDYLRHLNEIVKYLRQQDDIVVRQADGVFLVNGRFRMSLTELTDRANRMRRRQGKPEFQSSETEQTPKRISDIANIGH
jgi:DNA-binding CsgD family transcriptional regulator